MQGPAVYYRREGSRRPAVIPRKYHHRSFSHLVVDGRVALIDAPRELKIRYSEHRVRVEYHVDGTREARQALSERLYDAMRRSVAALERQPVSRVRWDSAPFRFAARRDLAFTEEPNRRILADPNAAFAQRLKAAINIAWIERTRVGSVELSCLTVGAARILNLNAGGQARPAPF